VLIKYGASVDKANSKGETPLIRAVQMSDLDSVRLLVTGGANPDKRDALAGMSARDYAKRDSRVAAITSELDKVKPAAPKAKVQGPGL
jgi:ankyrin repeat protein